MVKLTGTPVHTMRADLDSALELSRSPRTSCGDAGSTTFRILHQQGYETSIRKDGYHTDVLLLQRDSQIVIDCVELARLQLFVSETQAQLKMCFPPSFFNIIEHLMVHMV